ncbi:MAG: hypothetical protein LBT00_06265 [Spirochaetaceae bacterium]|nr:hypothetical protein [Spirochaetaceae bacterium]
MNAATRIFTDFSLVNERVTVRVCSTTPQDASLRCDSVAGFARFWSFGRATIPTRFKLWAKIVSKRCLSAVA